MKKFSFFTLAKVVVGLAVIAGVYLGLEKFKSQPQEKQEPEIVRPVKTVRLQNAGSEKAKRYFGTVQGAKRVKLSFRVSGPLVELPAEKGAAVKEGDLLARIDPRDFKTKLEQAESQQKQAQAQYREASSNFTRYTNLYNKKIIPATQYDSYKRAFDVAKSAVQAADSQVTAARDALKDTELRAPFAGIIADRMADNYQDVTAKQEILNLQDISTLEIVFNVPEKDLNMSEVRAKSLNELLASYHPSMDAVFDAIPGYRFPVALKEFSAQADSRTNTYAVTVTMPQPRDVHVLPGMAVTVHVIPPDAALAGAFSVPATSVLNEDGKNYLWRYTDGVMNRVPVDVITMHDGGTLEVKSDLLHSQDIIAVYGVHYLREGQKVRLMEGAE